MHAPSHLIHSQPFASGRTFLSRVQVAESEVETLRVLALSEHQSINIRRPQDGQICLSVFLLPFYAPIIPKHIHPHGSECQTPRLDFHTMKVHHHLHHHQYQ